MTEYRGMTPEQEAAAEMRDRIIEAAFNEKVDGNASDDGNVSDDDLTYNRAIDHVVAAIRALPLPEAKPDPRDAALAKAISGLSAMIAEWDKLTRYGSPIAKSANENLRTARLALADLEASLNGRSP